jgi:predicted MFS family arabinose efflux permease
MAAWKLGREEAQPFWDKFDLAGAFSYGVSLLALSWAFALSPRWCAVFPLLAGLGGLGLFVLWEGRAPHPILDVRMFRRNAVFAFSNLAALINYAATFAVGFLLSLYLQHIRNLGPREAGLVLLAQPALMVLFSPLAGRLSDSIQPRVVASLGMALCALALGLLSFLAADTPLARVVGVQMLLGLGFALFSSPNQNAVMSSVGPSVYGVAAAVLSTMRMLGQVASLGLVTLLFSIKIGPQPIGPQVHQQFMACLKLGFPILAAVCAAGIAASLARGRVRRG